jgi:hypothetical protein
MKTIFPTALLVVLLVACGGGGSSDNGGIGGTGFSQGAVTDVSMSARVTGTLWEFDTNTEFDPPSMGEADLQIGQVVLIEGTLGATNLATRVVFDDIIVGPVIELRDILPTTTGLKQFMILDTVVVIGAEGTSFQGTTFPSLMDGDNVRVSGFGAPGLIVGATRIELAGSPGDVEFRGTVSTLKPVAATFDVGSVRVKLLGSTVLTGFDGSDIMDGDFVAVDGVIPDPDMAPLEVDAVEIVLRDQGIEDEGDLDDVEVEGIVTDFAGLGSFRVGGQLVSTFVEGVQFEPTNSSFVDFGAFVEIEGNIRGGVLLAEAVRLRAPDACVDAKIADPADVDVAAGTFALAGIDFSTDSSTRFDSVEDLSGIATCALLEICGILIDGVVRATQIECENEGGAVTIRAEVDAFDARVGTFDLLGVEIDTGTAEFDGFCSVPFEPNGDCPDTEPFDETDFYLFLAANPNAVIEARDMEDDGDPTTFGSAEEVVNLESQVDDD